MNGSVYGREGTQQSKKRPYNDITPDESDMHVDKVTTTKKQMKLTTSTPPPKKA